MRTLVEIEWDEPQEQAWLCADNISIALHAYCKNTKFTVRELAAERKARILAESDCAAAIMREEAEREAREETQAMLNAEHDAHMECHQRTEAAEAQLATERKRKNYAIKLKREFAAERKNVARLRTRAEEAERELYTAIQHCCNSYWNDGHGARVKERYGFDTEEK